MMKSYYNIIFNFEFNLFFPEVQNFVKKQILFLYFLKLYKNKEKKIYTMKFYFLYCKTYSQYLKHIYKYVKLFLISLSIISLISLIFSTVSFTSLIKQFTCF